MRISGNEPSSVIPFVGQSDFIYIFLRKYH